MARTQTDAPDQITRLVKLGETDLTVANPAEDIRGRKVFDRGGEEIGKVDALLLDEREAKVRFLEVKGGGFLGIGDRTVLLPVDAITHIMDDEVHVDQTREHISASPEYDPELAQDDRNYLGGYYSYYGYAPYWTPGYAYPGFVGAGGRRVV
jgi:sporulation protein YlmC with PRC-barrel domain